MSCAYRKLRPGPLRLPQGPCNMLYRFFCILLISNVLLSFGEAHHPDPRSLRTIHRLQTGQPDHSAASTTTNNARTCSASNPGLTIRLRPFLSRISTLASPGVLGPCPATCTSRNFVGVSSSSRFFHTKKYGRHKPCSRQNAFTLCPLRACSETSLRHFIQAFFERLVMSQHCNATRIFTRCGSRSAHSL